MINLKKQILYLKKQLLYDIIKRTILIYKRGRNMTISYNNLWKLLIDKGLNKGDLRKMTGISSSTVAKMTNGEAVTLTVIEKICDKLECNIEDVVEIKGTKRD